MGKSSTGYTVKKSNEKSWIELNRHLEKKNHGSIEKKDNQLLSKRTVCTMNDLIAINYMIEDTTFKKSIYKHSLDNLTGNSRVHQITKGSLSWMRDSRVARHVARDPFFGGPRKGFKNCNLIPQFVDMQKAFILCFPRVAIIFLKREVRVHLKN